MEEYALLDWTALNVLDELHKKNVGFQTRKGEYGLCAVSVRHQIRYSSDEIPHITIIDTIDDLSRSTCLQACGVVYIG